MNNHHHYYVPRSTLEIEFDTIRDNQLLEQEVANVDLTHKFFKEIDDIFKYKELLNVAVIGRVATGKSTVAMKLCKYVLNNFYNKKFTIDHVCDDQLTFSRVVKDISIKNTCYVIDEDNRLSRAYLGSTIETTQLQSFSEIQAQRFIGRIYCSPYNIEDTETHIILEVISADKRNMITKCKVYYRKNTPLGIITQLLGYVDIDVSEIINSSVERIYRRMKFKKMDLMNKYAINDRRALDDSRIILTSYNKLAELSKSMNVSRSLIDLTIKKVKFDMGLNLSILQEDTHSRDVEALLKLKREISVNRTKGITAGQEMREQLLEELIDKHKKVAEVYNDFINLKYEDLKVKQ